MPEATMYKNNRPVFGKNNIWFAGQVFYVQPVTETISMQEPAHEHFGLGVLAFYAAHVVAAGCLVVYIGHGVKLRQISGSPAGAWVLIE